ncbi:MAG TPA: hypothetical protein VII36_03695 [Usitatibacter sp.]
MPRSHSIPIAMVFIAALVILLAARSASGADAERGAALYEARCGDCHSESVHGREKRVARDFGEVRKWVSRWNENLGLRWGDEELDDVSVYLNNTYYRYTCPPQVCKVISLAPRSALGAIALSAEHALAKAQ